MPHTRQAFAAHRYLHPRHWPTWLGVGLLWLSTRLPYSWMLRVGRFIGELAYRLMPGRRRIVRTNLRLCFPQLDEPAIRRLMRESFHSASIAVLESALSWWGSDAQLQKRYRIEGLEHLEAATARGKGVLLLGGHYTTLEISGRLLAYHNPRIYPTYKPAHNPLFDALMVHARKQRFADLLPSRDMRGMLRALKQGGIVWYAPDQDFGRYSSVFAPFMGVATSTLTLTARIARSAGVTTLPLYSERLEGNAGYLLRIGPPLGDFPSGDDLQDATTVNQTIEAQVRRTPGQYLWGHRRFKTRPPGEPLLYRPRRDRHMKRYSRLLALLSLPFIGYTAYQAWRGGGGKYLRERLGLSGYGGHADLWLHAASVGEVNAVIPLLRLLQHHHPTQRILLTTNTPSGLATARKQLADDIHLAYLPVDMMHAVKRFVHSVTPACALIVETELWPNLYEYCAWRGVRIIIVNGRLSEKSIHAPRWRRAMMCRAIEYTQKILARSELDRQRFIEIGADEQQVETLGNLKFAAAQHRKVEPILLDRPYLLAASTRDGEELPLAEAFLKLNLREHLLVIVPRHPQRAREILKQLSSSHIKLAQRSINDSIKPETQIYLADTFGELPGFIAGSDLVIMGGSFNPFGGQNIIEAGGAGKAVIFGPYMENFHEEAGLFLDSKAGIQIDNVSDLTASITKLFSDHSLLEQIGQNGLNLVKSLQDIDQKYYVQVKKICPLKLYKKPTH